MSTRRSLRPAGFTLIELLVVVAIMVVLCSFIAPALTTIQDSNNLAAAGQTVADEISVARQYAASRDQTVQVRFIIPSTSRYNGYSIVQLWKITTSGTTALDKLYRLPPNVEVSANSTISPLVAVGSGGLSGGTATTMPTGSLAGKYVAFTIRPDGNVIVASPPSNGTAANQAYPNGAFYSQPYYFLTVLPVRDSAEDTANTLPKNYVTIQVNPDTARTQIFRP